MDSIEEHEETCFYVIAFQGKQKVFAKNASW